MGEALRHRDVAAVKCNPAVASSTADASIQQHAENDADVSPALDRSFSMHRVQIGAVKTTKLSDIVITFPILERSVCVIVKIMQHFVWRRI